MCDDLTFNSDEAASVTRRGFGVISAAALAACTTVPPNAAETAEQDVRITTPDGEADAYFVHPASGRAPAVLLWPDIFALRPGIKLMGKRLAQSGYAVLVPNQFYRVNRGPVMAEGESFDQPAVRERLIGMARALTPDMQVRDATAFGGFLDAQASVDTNRKMGVQGYCMGGPLSFRTGATLPNRIGAVASFHGGGLVTDQPDSPHLLIPQTNAQFLVAIAQNDHESEPNAKNVLRQAFDAAHKQAEVEVYPARHGWCPPDSPVYDQVQAERAWARLLALYSTVLA